MGEYKPIFRELAIRGLVCLPIFILAGVAWRLGGPAGPLLCLPFLIVIGLILWSPVAELTAEPIRSIFYPTERFDRPQPMYGVPQSLRKNGKHEEALIKLQEIAGNYPEEIRPWLDMIEILVLDIKDNARAEDILRRAMAHHTGAGVQDMIVERYKAHLSRLKEKPDWLVEQQKRILKTTPRQDTRPVEEPDGATKRRFHPGGYNRPVE